MSRILAIDWDGVEARFALGTVLKDRLIVLRAGAAEIADAAEEIAEAALNENPQSDEFREGEGDADAQEGEDGAEYEEAEVVETVEKSVIPRIPVADDDEEEEEADGIVVSVKKSKRESFKTSPLALSLKKLLRDNKVGKALVCYAAERGDVDVMFMTIPQTTEVETPEIVYNQVLRDSLTFNETQPLDYMPLGLSNVKKSGARRVAAASIARDKLRRITETLAGAIRTPSKIELREPSLSEFLRARYSAILPGINMLLYAIALLAVIRFRPTGILGWYMNSKFKNFIDTKILKKPPVEVFETAEQELRTRKEA